MNQSLIQAYTDAFVAAMDAATGPDVLVLDGPPPPAYLQTGAVAWVGDVASQQTLIGLGSAADSGPKEEIFDMSVHISIYGAIAPNTTNAHQLQGRQAFGIFETIAATLRADETLGLTPAANPRAYVRFAEARAPMTVRKGGNDANRETALSFVVYVEGFLDE